MAGSMVTYVAAGKFVWKAGPSLMFGLWQKGFSVPHNPEQATSGCPPLIVIEKARFALEMTIPLAWHDVMKPFPKKVEVASCFAVKFRERLIGVTAAHVLGAFQKDRRQNPGIGCQLSSLPFDLAEAVIDHDDDLDLATFELSEAQLHKIGRPAFGCQEIWPPPAPDHQIQVSLAGYPNYLFATDAEGGVLPKAVYVALPLVEDMTDREIVMKYDPAIARGDPDIPLPPLGANLSGCSGGPLILTVLIDGTRLHAFPIGVIVAGPRKEYSQGEFTDFDVIRARRSYFIRPDGMIERPEGSGWLPP
jgi:hypothetical protein